jgi:hypothetical protein
MFLLFKKLNIAFEQLTVLHNWEGSVNINLTPEISFLTEAFVIFFSPPKKMLGCCLKIE